MVSYNSSSVKAKLTSGTKYQDSILFTFEVKCVFLLAAELSLLVKGVNETGWVTSELQNLIH